MTNGNESKRRRKEKQREYPQVYPKRSPGHLYGSQILTLWSTLPVASTLIG